MERCKLLHLWHNPKIYEKICKWEYIWTGIGKMSRIKEERIFDARNYFKKYSEAFMCARSLGLASQQV